MKFEFRRLDVAPQNEEFMLANVDNIDRNKQTARNSMFQRKSTKLTHPISVIEFCVFLRFPQYSRFVPGNAGPTGLGKHESMLHDPYFNSVI